MFCFSHNSLSEADFSIVDVVFEVNNDVLKENIVVKQPVTAKSYVAELFGTFVLVLMGCGSAVLAGAPVGPLSIGTIGVAFAFGLALLIMVYAIGGISGCHINPAVTISMLAAGKIGTKNAAIYIIVQCVGALIGALVVYGIALGNPNYSLAVNGLAQNGYDAGSPAGFSLASCFLAEVVFTFIFLMVILSSTSHLVPKGFAGIPIGLSLVLIHLVDIAITNASVNPARSLGPAVIVGGLALEQLWLFWVAPIIGGLLAALFWRSIR